MKALTFATTFSGVAYNWFLIILGFILPTLVIIASNVLVMEKVRKVIFFCNTIIALKVDSTNNNIYL